MQEDFLSEETASSKFKIKHKKIVYSTKLSNIHKSGILSFEIKELKTNIIRCYT